MTKQTVNIHGKEYETVASRVTRFREDTSKDLELFYAIETQLVKADDKEVIFKAVISIAQFGQTPIVIGTGYAHEKITNTGINSSSALEVCETSAIGRALASLGYLGTEYASADEVANAISRQPSNPVAAIKQQHLSGDQVVTEEQLTQINFLPGNLNIDKDTRKKIWDSLYQQHIWRGKFDSTTMSYPDIKLKVSDVPKVVAAFAGAAGKTPDSIEAMTKQILGDVQVDEPTNLDDYSDEPF